MQCKAMGWGGIGYDMISSRLDQVSFFVAIRNQFTSLSLSCVMRCAVCAFHVRGDAVFAGTRGMYVGSFFLSIVAYPVCVCACVCAQTTKQYVIVCVCCFVCFAVVDRRLALLEVLFFLEVD
ncbi:hypothetical protein BZA77DRAFT_159274 [Pyronema omphalodes]|nr:hypothetical protein BZA77DRAFT_159274 [Pyronema omphalodes]